MHPLDPRRTSAQRKLARGIEQIETLCREAKTFESAKAYVFTTEPEPRSAHEIAYHSCVEEKEAPPFYWPLLAGEGIQNLRSALDHAVWAVPNRKSNRLQYPIFTDACEFEVIGRKMLPGIPKPIRAAIEETQPYRRLPNTPALDVLELLRSFSNIDKHRTLATLACAVDFEGTYSADDVTVRWEKTATGKTLGQGKAEVSVIVATSERDITGMKMNPHLSYEVRIEGRPLDFLPVLINRVVEGVGICEGGKPLPA